MRQQDDMDWEEEHGSEKRQGNSEDATIHAAVANEASEETRRPGQYADIDFNTKLDIVRAEFQLEFRKLRDQMAEEVAKMTAI
jgi:hypothetical protein